MYHAKDLGRDNVQFYNEAMNRKAVQRLELENDLRHALDRGELELYYQPQYQAAVSGRQWPRHCRRSLTALASPAQRHHSAGAVYSHY